jgi:hypothetical protein
MALRSWNDFPWPEVAAINIADPFSIESTQGLSEFVVLRSQVSEVANPQRLVRAEAPVAR